MAEPAPSARVRRVATVVRDLGLTAILPWLLPLTLLAAGGRIIVPLLVQRVLDASGDADAASAIPTVVSVGLAALLVAGIASSLMNRALVRIAEQRVAGLRSRLFSHVLRLPQHEQDAHQQGTIVSRVVSDLDTVTQYIAGGGVHLVLNLGQMVLAVAVMVGYSWPLALLVLVLAVPILLLMGRVRGLIGEKHAAVRARVGELHAAVSDLVVGFEVLRVFGLRRQAQRTADRAVDGVETALRRTQWPLHMNTAIGEASGNVITVIVLWAGVLLGTTAMAGELTGGELVAYLFLINFFVRPMQFTVANLGEAQSAIAGLRRAISLLHAPAEHDGADAGTALPASSFEIVVEDLGFGYVADQRVLADIDLAIPPHEFVAVVGETGSGKTTFGKLLSRQLRAQQGRIVLGGVDLSELSARSLVRRVAVVPQEPFLFDRSIRENLLLARPDATPDGLEELLESLGLDGWIARLPRGIETRVGRGGASLSSGQRQLVALARTALLDPSLLILDEATSNLDPSLDRQVQRTLREIARERTTIAIAHRLPTALTADRVLVFADGRVVEDGAPQQLLRQDGPFARLHDAWGGGGTAT